MSTDPIKRHRERHKLPAKKKEIHPFERIANALERLADAAESNAMSQAKASRFLMEQFPTFMRGQRTQLGRRGERGPIKLSEVFVGPMPPSSGLPPKPKQ